MPLQMPQVGQGMNPLIMQALMQQGQGVGGPQLPQPAMRPSGPGMGGGGGYSMTGPAPQQPARPGVGGMMQNPMQMAMMGQMLKGAMAPPLPIGAASGGPLGSLGSTAGGAQFAPGSMDLTSMIGGTAGGMDVGGGLGAGVGAPSYGGLGAMNFGGGLSAPGWGAGTGSSGLMGSMFGGGMGAADAGAFEGGAWLGGGAAAGLGSAGAAEGIGATIAANPELWALAFA